MERLCFTKTEAGSNRKSVAYEHVAEMIGERGVRVDASCIWRWVPAYAPELDKRCRPHLKPTNKSYRTDETYIRSKGRIGARSSHGEEADLAG